VTVVLLKVEDVNCCNPNLFPKRGNEKGRKRYVEWAMYVSCPVLFRQPPKPPKSPQTCIFSPQASLSQATQPSQSSHCRAIVAAQPIPVPALSPVALLQKVVYLLLLALRLQVLVGAEGQRTADQDDGVQADACRGAVGGRGGGAGLCVALGLGVALLFWVCQLAFFLSSRMDCGDSVGVSVWV
jgi:hypothetical protein